MIDVSKIEKRDQDYFLVGNPDDIVVNSSLLQYIDPTQNGNPRKFIDALVNNKEKKTSKSLETGGLLHEWVERREDFIIADESKPTEAPALLMECFHNAILTSDFEDSRFETVPNDKEIKSAISALLLEFNGTKDYENKDFVHMYYCFRRAIEESNYKAATKPETIARHIINNIEYYNFLKRADGKVALTRDIAETLKGAHTSLINNPKVQNLLFAENTESRQVIKEIPFYFTCKGEYGKLKCKAKLDNIIIDFDKKEIIINDLKTYGEGSIYNKYIPIRKEDLGQTSFEYYRTYRQLSLYRIAVNKCLVSAFPELEGFRIKVNIVAVETTGYYESDVFEISHPWIYKGNSELSNLFERICYHRDNNTWKRSMEFDKDLRIYHHEIN